MTARQTAIAAIADHRIASTQDYLEHAGQAIYGEYVFHEDAQREYLAKPIFKKLRRTIEGHEPFDPAIVRPSLVGFRNESCFSAVEPVIGTNQWV